MLTRSMSTRQLRFSRPLVANFMNDNPIQPLTLNQRRCAGVLVEKSKTTPDVYPMTLNSIRNACNQKSNRSPVLDLNEDRVEATMHELREIGAVIEVFSSGRTAKFKHELYEWLGVDKAELAVLAELLLRGEQTLGELRARSSRMESSLVGLGDLVPVVNRLIDKGLVMELTPKGRGQKVTHNLYTESELSRFQNEYPSLSRNEIQPRGALADENATQTDQTSQGPATSAPVPTTTEVTSTNPIDSPTQSSNAENPNELAAMKTAIAELRIELADVKKELAELKSLIE